jgi:hypothetical protein
MLELEATGCKGKGKRQAIICLGHCKTLEQGPIDAWRRERVGRTSTTVEAIGEAPALEPTAAGTRPWWRRCGIEEHTEEEWVCGVNPEVVGDSPAWTQRGLGSWSVRTRWLWRHGDS